MDIGERKVWRQILQNVTQKFFSLSLDKQLEQSSIPKQRQNQTIHLAFRSGQIEIIVQVSHSSKSHGYDYSKRQVFVPHKLSVKTNSGLFKHFLTKATLEIFLDCSGESKAVIFLFWLKPAVLIKSARDSGAQLCHAIPKYPHQWIAYFWSSGVKKVLGSVRSGLATQPYVHHFHMLL